MRSRARAPRMSKASDRGRRCWCKGLSGQGCGRNGAARTGVRTLDLIGPCIGEALGPDKLWLRGKIMHPVHVPLPPEGCRRSARPCRRPNLPGGGPSARSRPEVGAGSAAPVPIVAPVGRRNESCLAARHDDRRLPAGGCRPRRQTHPRDPVDRENRTAPLESSSRTCCSEA